MKLEEGCSFLTEVYEESFEGQVFEVVVQCSVSTIEYPSVLDSYFTIQFLFKNREKKTMLVCHSFSGCVVCGSY